MKRKRPSTINESKLKELYDEYVKLYNSDSFSSLYRREQIDMVYSLFLHRLKKDESPQILSDEEYAKYRGEELYRGSGDAKWLLDLLTNKHRVTFGEIGKASYSSNEKSRAREYAKNNEDNILTFKMKLGTRAIYSAHLIDNFYLSKDHPVPDEPVPAIQDLSAFVQNLPDSPAKNFFTDLLTGNMCFIALLAGYDVLFTPISKKENYYQIINRHSIIVSQKEYDRFLTDVVEINPDAAKDLFDQYERIENKKIVVANLNEASVDDPQASYLFAYMLYRLGYDKKPEVVKKEVYDSLEAPIGLKEGNIYRGLSNPEHVKELISDDEYHFGDGAHGLGLYFTPNYAMSKIYTLGGNNDNILTAKLSPSAKVIDGSLLDYVDTSLYILNNKLPKGDIDFTSLTADGYEPAEGLCKKLGFVLSQIKYTNKVQFEDFLDFIHYNPSFIAMLLGYDAIKIDEDITLVLNREKLVVEQSEYDRFVHPSAEEKGDD